MSLAQLIDGYGYALVTGITLVEGESIVLLAGAAVALGELSLPIVVAAAVVGSVAGDQACFHLGRRAGLPWLARHPRWRQRMGRVLDLIARHETRVLLSFRFYYGLRALTPFALGVAGVPPARCLMLNVVGAAAWALTFASIGCAVGAAAGELLADHLSEASALVACVACALVVAGLLAIMRGRADGPGVLPGRSDG